MYIPKTGCLYSFFARGGYFYKNRHVNFLYKIVSFLFRACMKISYNRYNHYPLGIWVGGGLCLPHNIGIVLSGNAVIGEFCTIFHEVTIGVDCMECQKAPRIGNHVLIGAGAKVIGDVTIGNNVKIGANAVVTKNIPDNCVVVGCNKILG